MPITRMSSLMLKTLREAPAEADLVSHRLLLRAGLITPIAAGIYAYTPVGWRVFRRIENIIREEMDAIGGQEVHLPALQPLEFWERSGRAASMGAVLFRLQDRREREFALGPTHEEVVSEMASRMIQSYRDLPFTLYQIQTKFRDEARPRGGLIRVREFAMKDAYSFDPDWESLDGTYDAHFGAYKRIFQRAGVPVIPVMADSGAIGGKDSQEFIFLTEAGEDTILLCDSCGYAANSEKADFRRPDAVAGEPAERKVVDTPGAKTIADVAALLGLQERQTLKAVFFHADGEPVFVVIRGDLEVNEVKLKNLLKVMNLTPMDDAAVKAAGLVAGYASPVGLEGVRIIADTSAAEAPNLVAGGNAIDKHEMNVNYERDWQAEHVADIALARGNDRCARCEGVLEEQRGIEMGHVFKLGTVYSEKLGVEYLDEQGGRQPVVMGCYGIGVERMIAAAVEANHDDNGIIWPASIAPYDVHVVVINADRPEITAALVELERRLEDAGLSILLDDRSDSPGSKFKDADLLGIPARVTISPRALEKGGLELLNRRTRQQDVLPIPATVEQIESWRAADED